MRGGPRVQVMTLSLNVFTSVRSHAFSGERVMTPAQLRVSVCLPQCCCVSTLNEEKKCAIAKLLGRH